MQCETSALASDPANFYHARFHEFYVLPSGFPISGTGVLILGRRRD
jgi:hypothetical protein